jgi:hypothetical protein
MAMGDGVTGKKVDDDGNGATGDDNNDDNNGDNDGDGKDDNDDNGDDDCGGLIRQRGRL